jgi:polysaccharide pyruvyl transferase WcaK-like protein
MTHTSPAPSVTRPGRPWTVGFFGILGAGNLGNDASFEAMLGYLHRDHPDVVIDAMCTGPERVRATYGIQATPLHYRLGRESQTWRTRANQGSAAKQQAPRIGKILRIGIETAVNCVRLASWVRRHDVVVVPGAGVLEVTQPIRPWGTPLELFVLSLSGKAFGTKVAFVCVGASPVRQRLTRLLYVSAANLAYYRSFRDAFSRDAMRRQGVDVSADHIYPDLAFSIPPLDIEPGDPQTVGLGVMAYYGNNDDREQAGILHESYNAKLKLLTRRLIADGRNIRLFVGDTNGSDQSIIDEILEDIRIHQPNLEAGRVTGESTFSFTQLMAAMAPCGVVIAARYHNVMCALKLAKPTIATGYSAKHNILMTDLGMAEYSHDIRNLDVDSVLKQLADLEIRSTELRRALLELHAEKSQGVEGQFTELSAVLFKLPTAITSPRPEPRGASFTGSWRKQCQFGPRSARRSIPGCDR